jgi:hypothetical protein
MPDQFPIQKATSDKFLSAKPDKKFSIQKIAGEFQRTGKISLWSQGILGVIAIVLVFSYALFGNPETTPGATVLTPGVNPVGPGPGSGVGLIFAIGGVLVLSITTFWAFRYMRFGKQLQADDPEARPTRAEAMQLLNQGLIGNLLGMLLSIVGSQAIAGSLFLKAMQQQGAFVNLVKAIDMMGVQASTNAITAHFIGLVASLWLLNRVSR